jgi:hypothetical protein
MLFIATQTRGVKLKLTANPSVTLNPIWGVPIPSAIIRALIVSIVVVGISVMFIDNVVIASSLCMVVGLTGQLFGAVLYKIERFFRNLITG